MPSNVDRYTAGGTGTLLAVVLLWLLREYVGVAPPPEVSNALSGLIVVFVGALYSRFGGVNG